MDVSQSEETSNLSISVELNNKTSEAPMQNIESSKESAKAEQKELNSVEFAQEETVNVENSTVENSSVINDVQETIQNVESSKEPAKAGQKELNSVESAEEETENIENSTAENNGEIYDVVQREADDQWVLIQKEFKELSRANVELMQKETIEILNVELVAAGSDNFVKCVNTNTGTSSQENANEKGVSASNFSIEVMEIEEQEQMQNETTLDGVDIVLTQDKHNQNLANCTKICENSTEPPTASGLSLLAQYESDDDADSVVEVPITTGQDYRNQVVEIDSDSDTDDSSCSSDVEYLNELRKTIEKRIEVADEDDAENEDHEGNSGKRRPQLKLKVKGELLLEDLPPIQDLQITVPENDCIVFGKIHSIVDQLVLVSALPNSILLDLETVIFLEKGQKVLGEVFDVLGQVADPLYCVRFNSNKQILEKQIEIGDVVYVAPKSQYTQYVILSNLMKTKGSDASWENDMEPPPKFLDYSDDEQEQLAKRQQRNKDRPTDNEDQSKRPRTVDNDASTSKNSSYHPNPQYRNSYEHRNNRGSPAGHSNVSYRPRYNGPNQHQQRTPTHHRSSWHSNYYPKNLSPQPTNNYRMHSAQNQPQSPQGYNPNMPFYDMPPPAHNMQYPPPQRSPYAAVPNFGQNSAQSMPNTFSVRPPNFHGPPPPHAPHPQQYSSNPPPPPGSQ